MRFTSEQPEPASALILAEHLPACVYTVQPSPRWTAQRFTAPGPVVTLRCSDLERPGSGSRALAALPCSSSPQPASFGCTAGRRPLDGQGPQVWNIGSDSKQAEVLVRVETLVRADLLSLCPRLVTVMSPSATPPPLVTTVQYR